MRATMSQQPPTTRMYIICDLRTYLFLPKNYNHKSNAQVPGEPFYLVMVYNVYDVSPKLICITIAILHCIIDMCLGAFHCQNNGNYFQKVFFFWLKEQYCDSYDLHYKLLIDNNQIQTCHITYMEGLLQHISLSVYILKWKITFVWQLCKPRPLWIPNQPTGNLFDGLLDTFPTCIKKGKKIRTTIIHYHRN